jgi:hypothetical protein
MTTHSFKQSPLVGSDRCKECGEVRTHVNHAYAIRADELDVNMLENLHNIPYEHIQLIKGVAFLMLCEKVADSQPFGSKITAQQVTELWVRNAISALAAEGVFKLGPAPQPGVKQ